MIFKFHYFLLSILYKFYLAEDFKKFIRFRITQIKIFVIMIKIRNFSILYLISNKANKNYKILILTKKNYYIYCK